MKTFNFEQRSEAWRAIRCGMPTASEFSKLVKASGEASDQLKGYATTLAAEKFAGRELDSFQSTSWMERGQELEAEAIRFYQFDQNCDVDPVGFVTDDNMHAGCSPDGLIGEIGGIEVKCLKSENHINAILYYQKHGRSQPAYIQQVQGALMLTGRRWWDQLFFHPDLPPLIIRQTPDVDLHLALAQGIEQVCRERDVILEALRRHASPVKVAA